MTGLEPRSTIPQYFRDLYGTPPEIESKIHRDHERILAAGYDGHLFYVEADDVQAGLDYIEAFLKAGDTKGVMIGTGLRLIPEQTAVFEKVVDVARRTSPGSVFMFNDGPGGNYDAIMRNKERL